MRKRTHQKLVRLGNYVVEVEVELVEANSGWSPYLSLEDAYKLDDAREALQAGDIKRASQFGRVFTLTPVSL